MLVYVIMRHFPYEIPEVVKVVKTENEAIKYCNEHQYEDKQNYMFVITVLE